MFSSIHSIPGLIFARSDVKAKIRPSLLHRPPAFAFAVSYRETLKGMRMGGSKKRVDAQFSKRKRKAWERG